MSNKEDIARTRAPDGASTDLAVRSKDKPAQVQQLPPFRLLLHNDDVNTMDDVVRAIVTLTPLGTAAAIRKMLDAHRSGVSLLLTTHKERGELYVDQFTTLRITTSLEAGS